MKRLVVVAATDEDDAITFSVIHRQDEVLYGRLHWMWFDKNYGDKVDITARCYERNSNPNRMEGFYEGIFPANGWLGNQREQIQDEFIKKVIARAMPDGKVVRIINI